MSGADSPSVAQIVRIARLLRPRSIAVIGGLAAARVAEQCDRMGFDGTLWPVHPKRDRIAGRPVFRSVADLPEVPDAAFVGVNRHATVEVVAALAQAGAGGAICHASGFRESDDGEALQQALVEAAGVMPILGPNCYGLLNFLDGIALWPDQHGGRRLAPDERGVAIVSQSSNIAISMTMQRRGLPVAYVATAGNQAQLGLSRIARALLDDGRMSALGLHVEGFDSVRGFETLAREARARKVPVVVMKTGRSERGRAANLSHTASIAGSDAGADAFLRRLGFARASGIPEFLETLKLFHVHGALGGSRLGVMCCSGGEASVVSDAVAETGLTLPEPTPDHAAAVKETLHPLVPVANPLDYHTFSWGDGPALARIFTAFARGGFDAVLLVLDFPRPDRCDDAEWEITANAFDRAMRASGAKGVIAATLGENLPEARAAQLTKLGIAPLAGVREALAAIECAARVGAAWRAPARAPILVHPAPGNPGSAPDSESEDAPGDEPGSKPESAPEKAPGSKSEGALGDGPRNDSKGALESEPRSAPILLDEAAGKRWLAEFGVPVPPGSVAHDAEAAVEIAASLGGAVAMKALGIAHKTERQAVRLGLHRPAEIRDAARALLALGPGVLVERFETEVVAELIVGLHRDPQLGLLLAVGSGGTLVELVADSVTLLLPVTESEVRDALSGLRSAPMLRGWRGRSAADVDAAVASILAIADFAIANGGRIEELDVNPLGIRAKSGGAVALDALIRTGEIPARAGCDPLRLASPASQGNSRTGSDEVIKTRREGGILEVTLDRPKANAIDLATSRIMGETFKAFRDDPELRVVIVTGAGERFFSAGWDLKAAADGDAVDGDYGVGGFAGLQELPGLNKPVIAAVNGMAVGGGFELALACDMILASSTASFALPEIRAGTLADAATIKLPKRMPFHIAMELLLTGRWMGAEEAHRWGVVNEVLEPAKLLERAWEIARRLESGPPLVFAAIKEVAREAENLRTNDALSRVGKRQFPTVDRLYDSEDQMEGFRAFAEKRDPVWRGR